MPIRVHPEAAWWEFRGDPETDSLRLRVKDPVDDYWEFDNTTPDYLVQSDGLVSDFVASGDFTVMAWVRLDESPANHQLINKHSDTTQRCWSISFVATDTLRVQISRDGTNWVTADVSYSHSNPMEMLVALVYTASTGTVVGYVIHSGGTSSNSNSGSSGAVYDSNAPVRLAVQSGLGGAEWSDRIYWWAYVESALTQQNLEDILDNQDTHPMDFDCLAYDDFHDTVGASHTSLIGEYVFSISGAPTHVGNGGPTWPDPTRLFEPDRWLNDFSVLGRFSPDDIGAGVEHPIISKWNDNGVNQRCWRIRQVEDDMVFSISKDGTASGMTEVTVSSVLSAGITAFFSMRYEDKGDGSSDLICEVDGTQQSSSTAVAPVLKSNTADVQIATHDTASMKYLDGKIFWLAFWNRKITDTENTNIRTEFVQPQRYAPDYYDDFYQAVAAEKDSTIPGGDTYNPGWLKESFALNVDGTPIKGGVSESSADVYHDTPGSIIDSLIDFILGSIGYPERVYPRVSTRELLTQANIVDPDAISALTLLAREYPRQSTKDLGPVASVFIISPDSGV